MNEKEKEEALKNDPQHDANTRFAAHVRNRRWDEAKALFLPDSPCQPDSDKVNSIFKRITNQYRAEVITIVTFLCNLKGNNKLTQDTVSFVFERACGQQSWELVKLLGDMDGDNTPNQKAIKYANGLIEDNRTVYKPLSEILDNLKPRKQQKEQLKKSLEDINAILKTLETKIEALEKEKRSNISEAKRAAKALLVELTAAREMYEKKACFESVTDTKARKAFQDACLKAIKKAGPILVADDLSWGAYLTNIFINLANAVIWAVTLGNSHSFFASAHSESSAVVKQAEKLVPITTGKNTGK